MTYAAKLAVELARASGVGWVGARRSNHAGAGAIYAAIPVEHGMVGIYGAASSVHHMAPWGGTEPLLGTNPIAVAIPAGDEPPVILDIATSIASNGAIRTHQLEGRPMPEGWVQNRKDGAPITDPSRINEGTYLPMGGYKGYGLSLVIGLLAGPLNRAAFGRDIKDFAAPPGERAQCRAIRGRARRRALHRRPTCSRRRSTATSATSPPRGGCRASTRSACRDRAGSRAARSGSRTACRSSATLVAQVDEVAKSLGVTPLSART